MMKIMKILPFFLAIAKATEPIKTVSCDRGADQEPILTVTLEKFPLQQFQLIRRA